MYGLRESIAEIIEQTLETFQERHADNAQRLYEGLLNIGLELFVERPEERLPSITTIRIPHGVKLDAVQKYMLDRYVNAKHFVNCDCVIDSFLFFGLCVDTLWRFHRALG